MREIIVKKGVRKTVLKQYEDINQMPVSVFQRINKYWMLDSQVGSSMSDIDAKHLQKIALVAGDKEKTLDATSKLRQLIYNIVNESSFESLAFACSLYSVDGREITDRSEEALKKLLGELSDRGLTNDIVKKKRYANLFMRIYRLIFPISLQIRRA